MQALIQRNQALLKLYIAQKTEYKIKLHTMLAILLRQPRLFADLEVNTAIGLLCDLGYTYPQALEMYPHLLRE